MVPRLIELRQQWRGSILANAVIVIAVLVCLAVALNRYLVENYQTSLVQSLQRLYHTSVLDAGHSEFDYAAARDKLAGSGVEPLRASHPRIVLPALENWFGIEPSTLMQQRRDQFAAKAYEFKLCQGGDTLLDHLSGWLMNCRARTVESTLASLLNQPIVEQENQIGYGNGWLVALAYDQLHNHIDDRVNVVSEIETRIQRDVETQLKILEHGNAALWHGAATLAANTWLSASALNSNNAEHSILQQLALGEFETVLRALDLTGGTWPGGYSYWINNRAHAIALAGSAYTNTVLNSKKTTWAKKILGDVGYWHIYATRPDNRIEGFGDEGPRVDLKDETQRVIDLIATITNEPILSDYSDYLGSLYGGEAYYSRYEWSLPLYQNPNLTAARNENGLSRFTNVLPLSRLFGPDAVNQLYIRSSWTPQATFVSFRASDTFAHHGHYDAGHFTIFKGAPLALNSSVYGDGFYSPNRLNYAIRSVAKNTLLVLRPNEIVHPNRYFDDNVADGGQRVTLPTGSSIRTLAQWQKLADDGLHLNTTSLIAYDHEPDEYTYIACDLTRAYNSIHFDTNEAGGKVSRIERRLLYLSREDRIVVYDQITSTDKSYTKKWLLHTRQRPQTSGLRALRGTLDNGILETTSSDAIIENAGSSMRLRALLPRAVTMRLVGGPDYRYYVETDADEAALDGTNFAAGASEARWFDGANWRIEIQPSNARLTDEFLVVLTPRIGAVADRSSVLLETPPGTPATAMQTGQSTIVFVKEPGAGAITLSANSGSPIRIFGLAADQKIELKPTGASISSTNASNNGTAHVAPPNDGQMTISW